jgi:Fe-S cluster biogenesis protein NfuA
MPEADDVRAAGDRVDALLAELGTDAAVAAKADELVRTLVGLYGACLDRVMEIVTETGAAETLHRLTEDDLVAGLLIVHDLHPLTTADRVRTALDGVRPYLGKHDVELLDVTDGVVRIRLNGGGGCGSAAVADAVERAITSAAPEVSAVTIEREAALLRIGPRPPGAVPDASR